MMQMLVIIDYWQRQNGIDMHFDISSIHIPHNSYEKEDEEVCIEMRKKDDPIFKAYFESKHLEMESSQAAVCK
jgi:hypothetical protein